MISLPFRRARWSSTIDGLYGMIVAQARSPSFYRGYGVPDTVDGRLDMIVLHLVLVLRQLSKPHGAVPPEGQALFDRFCQDIDDNFREMGVGDLAVPKEMQRVGEAFYGRAKAYGSAISDGDLDALAAALARNVFGVADTPLGARRLATYMREAALRLGRLEISRLAHPVVEFPDPDAVAPPEAAT